MDETILARLRTQWRPVVTWAGLLACVGGLLGYRMWLVLPWSRLSESLLMLLGSVALAAAGRAVLGWAWANTLALAWLAALAFFAGALPMLATATLAATAVALGTIFVRERSAPMAVVALATGLALVAGCIGWLLPVPLHERWVYLVAAAVLCVWRARALRSAGIELWHGWHTSVSAAPWHAAAAVLALGLASTGAWLPTMQADDLAYHLGLPSQLLRHGFYALDPSQQLWALAPWLGDVVQGIAQVLAASEARGAVDALWMVAAAAGLGCAATSFRADVRMGWLVVALFASQPLLGSLAAGMQTELPAAALLAAFALAILRLPRDQLAGTAAILAGGLFALKFGQAIAALAMLGWALAHQRRRFEPRQLAVALGLFALVAGSSYWMAWQVSGNPMLPLFNDVFKSPLMPPHQLHDPRWHAGFEPLLVWALTFNTPIYMEAEPGGFGFSLVAFAGVWLVAILQQETRALALSASAVALLPMLPMQYARYAFPGIALLLVPMAVAGWSALGARRFAVVAFSLCALNLAFQANAGWSLATVARKRLLTHFGDSDLVLRRFAPERVLVADLRKRDGSDPVVLALDPEAPNVAELAGRGRTVAWYSPSLEAARLEAETDPGGQRWKALIDTTGARWLLLRPGRLSDAQRAALVLGGARKVSTVGVAELWSWSDPPSRVQAQP